jgi:hypothetical protein
MNMMQGKASEEKASKGKGEVVLCLIKHYAMKMYAEVIAACFQITLVLREGQ